MRALTLLGIVAASLLTAPAAARALEEREDGVERALRKYEADRARLEAAINDRRAEEGLEPVASDPALTRAAQEGVLTIARRLEDGVPLAEAMSGDELEEWLARAGYEPHEFAVSVAKSGDLPPAVAAWLMAPGRGQLRRADLPDVGIGIAPAWRSRVYLILVGRTADDQFAAEASALGSLEAVRARFLARTNEVRLEAARGRLERDACLDQVAQAYAERMLAEGFFSHTSPEGGEVADRARAGGCSYRTLGENLASGPTRVDEVVERWLASDSHRRVLLEERFDRMGLGLAMGRGAGGHALIWVQTLGAEALESAD